MKEKFLSFKSMVKIWLCISSSTIITTHFMLLLDIILEIPSIWLNIITILFVILFIYLLILLTVDFISQIKSLNNKKRECVIEIVKEAQLNCKN
jgi:hypothetical protein